MTLNSYFVSLGTATVLSWTAFLLVILRLNPFGEYNASFTFSLFYLTLFMALVGTFTIVLASLYSMREGGLQMYVHISTAFRQGGLLAILFIGLLSLQGMSMLTWWDGLLLAGGIACVEFLLLANKR